MEQILLAYALPKEIVTAIMMHQRNTNVRFCSPDGDTDFFEIIAGVLHRNVLTPHVFMICLDYLLRTSIDIIKENVFTLKKVRKRRYPVETITDADYAADL